jgi:uncharacterized protein YcbK (DUF882 family)
MRFAASAFAAFSLSAVLFPLRAAADTQHVVSRGHTVEAIANRYHVTTKAILEANHITDAKHIQPGDVLIIPTGNGTKPEAKEARNEARKGDKNHDAVANLGKSAARETTNYAKKPKTPGVVHIKRVAMNEEYVLHVGNRQGHISPKTLKAFETLMRSSSNTAHPIDPRLIALIGIVSNHFGGRTIEVVSGYRPFSPAQYNPHSNHMHGKAVDFRVVDVPNETLRDFCRTLKNVGCGYYPNSVFVHMDVRDKNTFWIDYSRPGEPPRYNAQDVEADEGASDVHDESTPSRNEAKETSEAGATTAGSTARANGASALGSWAATAAGAAAGASIGTR